MFSAQKLAEVLKDRQMTPYALAKRAQVSHQWVQSLLRGEIRMPRQPYMDKLTQALGVRESDLVDYPAVEESNGLPTEEELFKQLTRQYGRPGDDWRDFARWFEVYRQLPPERRKAALELLQWNTEREQKGNTDTQAQQG